jgi:hypothetical protein
MKNFLKVIVALALVVTVYFTAIAPSVVAYINGENIFESIFDADMLDFKGMIEDTFHDINGSQDSEEKDDGEEKQEGNNGPLFTTNSSSGNTTRFNNICSFDEYGFVWCTQKTSLLGFSSGCLLTSYSMLIINAGRYIGTEKNYDPVDVYLANNYKNTYIGDTTKPENRKVLAYHYVIASGFNYSWNSISLSGKTDSQKLDKLKEVLSKNPWGVVIGGSYGNGGTHYIVARLDHNGNVVFDDPAFADRAKGAKISSISNVYGINSWSKISSIMTITPNLDSNGKWKKGTWENCLTDSNCHVCYKAQNC